jgi:hypothetical protein
METSTMRVFISSNRADFMTTKGTISTRTVTTQKVDTMIIQDSMWSLSRENRLSFMKKRETKKKTLKLR